MWLVFNVFHNKLELYMFRSYRIGESHLNPDADYNGIILLETEIYNVIQELMTYFGIP